MVYMCHLRNTQGSLFQTSAHAHVYRVLETLPECQNRSQNSDFT